MKRRISEMANGDVVFNVDDEAIMTRRAEGWDSSTARMLAAYVIVQAIRDYLGLRRVVEWGGVRGETAQVFEEARKFLFEKSGEWARSREFWFGFINLPVEKVQAWVLEAEARILGERGAA